MATEAEFGTGRRIIENNIDVCSVAVLMESASGLSTPFDTICSPASCARLPKS